MAQMTLEQVFDALFYYLVLATAGQVIVEGIRRVTDRYTALVSIAVAVAIAVVSEAGFLGAIRGRPVRWPLADHVLTGLLIAPGQAVMWRAFSALGVYKRPAAKLQP